MSDVSKAVANRMAITRTLTSAIEVHGPEVVAALEVALFPEGVPANCDVRVLFAALGAFAQRAIDDVAAKDLTHAVELADDAGPRQEREVAKTALRESIFGVRSMLEGIFGSSIVQVYGLAGDTPVEADELLHMASAAEQLLRNRELVEKPLRAGISVDMKAIANELKTHIDALNKALGDVRREEREAQVTRDARNGSLTAWSTSYQGIADVVTGFFELAGRVALAERVRPTARRRAGLEDPAEQQPAPETPATP
jgi:hypothetical protein